MRSPISTQDFHAQLKNEVAKVFTANPTLPDHRQSAPWATGSLGSPDADVWFIAEYPSLVQVERVARNESPEAQWNKSKGDEVFRDMLVRHGLKRGGRDTPGGWNCYITNIVKSVARPAKWNAADWVEWFRVAEAWAPVLAWELEHGAPLVLAVQGARTKKVLDHLVEQHLLPQLPRVFEMWAPAYVASRPDRALGLGPMHPDRLAKLDRHFAAVVEAGRRARTSDTR
jgi:hypothetical protein